MQTPQEVKNWYLNDAYNSTLEYNDGTKLGFYYRFACTIPQNIIDLLLSKQATGQIYLGSNLGVLEDENTSYILFFYTYFYDSYYKSYLVGRTQYDLINYSVDYKKYLKSCDYIPVIIKSKNIDLSITSFTQAYKQGTNIGALRIDLSTNNNFATLDIYTKNKRSRYFSQNFKGINYYNLTPTFIYNFISTTPSVCKFANELLKQLKPSVSSSSIQKVDIKLAK